MIEINGAFCSSGGQILRTACALAAITKRPCRVFNIRKSRPKPGLATQHLQGIQALTQLCNGRVEGDFLGSKEIKFYPEEILAKDLKIKIETAGSITLILQALIPPALFASGPIKVTFDGGATDTFFSPSLDHFRYVFLKILEKMGAKVEANILRRGYYPEGGARVEVKIFPTMKNKDTRYQGDRRINAYPLKPLNLTERGSLKKILVISGAANALKTKKVAERQVAGVREILGKLKLPTEEKVEYYDTHCPGSQICLIAEFEDTIIGTDNLGKLGKPAEKVGRECALKLLEEEKSKACLDRHLADQLLIYLALAGGKSQVSVSQITSHTKTNIWTIQQFLAGEFKIKDNIISFQSVSSSD